MFENHEDSDRTESFMLLTEGTKVGHYTIIKKIGAGGMGEVYLAEDLDLERRVALKFLPARLADSERAKARFRREAQATARLNHPNIVTIHEVGEFRDSPFIAMEFIEGEILDAKIKKAPLSPEDTAAIIVQVARGLQAAHEQGVIHRDIKPGNICIRKDGRAKVFDFGLARVEDSKDLSQSRTVLGTVGYNSPEQINGKPVDERTDIWSLGILIYKMLTQKLPFAGEDAQTLMYSITHSRASDISGVHDNIPHPIQTVYRKCLEKDPYKRPQSMSEILNIFGVQSISYVSAGQSLKNQRTKKLVLGFLSIVFIAIMIWVIRPYLPDSGRSPTREVRRIGILPFHNKVRNDELSEWPSIIQALLVSNLTGVGDIGVVDPLSLNALLQSKFDTIYPPRIPGLYKVMRNENINYVVDGTIVNAGTGFQLHTNVIELITGEVIYSSMAGASGEKTLSESIKLLSNDILSYFQTKILHEDYDNDIRPWLSNRTQNLEALKAFMQANKFFFHGLIEETRQYLEIALELDSTFVAPRIYLISGLISRGLLDEAHRHYQILASLEHESNPFERAMISWVDALIDNDARRQVNSLKLALEYSPGNNILLYQLAHSHYSLKNYEQAVLALQPAIKNNWQYSPAYYLLGINYCNLNEYSRARHVLEKSLAVSPVYEHTYAMLAGLALKQGDKVAADQYEKTYLQTLEEKGENRGNIFATLAGSLLFFDLNENAIRCYKEAISYLPDESIFHIELGRLLFETKRWNEARDEFLSVLQLDSNYTRSYFNLGIIHDSLADTSNAVKYYSEYLMRDTICLEADKIRNRISDLRNNE